MRQLANNLMVWWLAVTLVIAPLQAVSAGAAVSQLDDLPCAMHLPDEENQNADASHCPACGEHPCHHGGECSDQSCVSWHLEPVAMVIIRLTDMAHSDSHIPLPATIFLSRTDPPLLRPPR